MVRKGLLDVVRLSTVRLVFAECSELAVSGLPRVDTEAAFLAMEQGQSESLYTRNNPGVDVMITIFCDF
jgi:hypothetical protein